MNASRPLNPMSDLFVRYLFGSEKNKDLLLHFINAVFSRKGHATVIDLDIRNPFNLREEVTSKESVLDVKARESHLTLPLSYRTSCWLGATTSRTKEPSRRKTCRYC